MTVLRARLWKVKMMNTLVWKFSGQSPKFYETKSRYRWTPHFWITAGVVVITVVNVSLNDTRLTHSSLFILEILCHQMIWRSRHTKAGTRRILTQFFWPLPYLHMFGKEFTLVLRVLSEYGAVVSCASLPFVCLFRTVSVGLCLVPALVWWGPYSLHETYNQRNTEYNSYYYAKTKEN